MDSQAKYGLVGAAVVLSTLMIIAFVLWLSEVGANNQVKYFNVYFKEHSLNGLQTDSDVTMKGIKIGSVVDYQISERDIEQVKVLLKLQESVPIKTDTRAVVKRNLLTGLATVELIGSSQGSIALESVLAGEDYPIIPEGRTDLDVLADSLPDLMSDVSSMVQEASLAFSEENRESLASILANLKKFSDVLATKDEAIGGMIEEVTKLVRELQCISKSLNGVAGNIDEQLNKIGDELNNALMQVSQTTETVGKKTEEVAKSVTNAVDVITLRTEVLSQDVSRAANRITAASEKFEDPRALIAKPGVDELGPGEELLLSEGGAR